jgi:hypothetical protein
MQKVNIDDLKISIDIFIKYAKVQNTTIFLLTKIGCGIAGFSEDEIKPLFAKTPANVIKPIGW